MDGITRSTDTQYSVTTHDLVTLPHNDEIKMATPQDYAVKTQKHLLDSGFVIKSPPTSILLKEGAYFTYPDCEFAPNGEIETKIKEIYTGQTNSDDHPAFIKDGALSFGTPRFTDPDNLTLTEIQKSLSSANTGDLKKFSQINPTEKKQTVESFLHKINDPVTRIFESCYAKLKIEKEFSSHNIYQVKQWLKWSNSITRFVVNYIPKKEIAKYHSVFYDNEGPYTDDYAVQIFTGSAQLGGTLGRIKKIIEQLDIPPNMKNIIMQLYLNRYYWYAIKNDSTVAKKFSDDLWGNLFPELIHKGRGRSQIEVTNGEMFRISSSHTVGIMRNFDPAPKDMQCAFDVDFAEAKNRFEAGNITRSPCRLEMTHPDCLDESDGFIQKLMRQKHGTYVTGPSGSILIVHGAIRATANVVFKDTTPKEITSFLEIAAILFIFLDGGHSMCEMTYPINSQVAKDKMVEAFGNEEFAQVGDHLFCDEDVLAKAASYTDVFSKAYTQKRKVHQEIRETVKKL